MPEGSESGSPRSDFAGAAPRYSRPAWFFRALQSGYGWLARREFWVFALLGAILLASFDTIYLRAVQPLVLATVLLGEVTSFLAIATFYSGTQQRQTNSHLEAIVVRLLEDRGIEPAAPILAPPAPPPDEPAQV